VNGDALLPGVIEARVEQKRVVLVARQRQVQSRLPSVRGVLFELLDFFEQFAIVMLQHAEHIGIDVNHGTAVTDDIEKGAVARSLTTIALLLCGFKSQSR